MSKPRPAEEWLTDPQCKERKTESDVVAWVQSIQLDAFRAGMKMAADIACNPDHVSPGSAVEVQMRIAKALFSAAENIKKLP